MTLPKPGRPIDYNDPTLCMGQHFIALICMCDMQVNKKTECHNRTYSGWLLEMHGQLFWVTAGHCLRDLDKNIENGTYKLVGSQFMDCFGYRAEHLESVPFTYEPGCGFFIFDKSTGFDFGLIKLSQMYRDLFATNKNIPITRKNWVHIPNLSFDFYRMFGIPEDCVYESEGQNGVPKVSVKTALMAVSRITLEEAREECTDSIILSDGSFDSDEWFVGKMDAGTGKQTIKGMSGGPIYGFRYLENGQLSYHVVALQSWWDKKPRNIFGCPVPYFAEKLYQAMEWALDDLAVDDKDVGDDASK